jgi:enoyl-CoA hydratase/carnithine racemase
LLGVDVEGDVIVWTIDRPAAKNALDLTTLRDLSAAVAEAGRSSTVRAAILTGANDVFVSGGDLRELREKVSPADADHFSDLGFALTEGLAALPFPSIAALSGVAIGGGAELALACDLRVADARASLAFKQVRMGVTTAWGTVPRLIALVGTGTAGRLLLTSQEVSATEAKTLGLVDEVTENGLAVTTARAWATEIARGAPGAVRAMKRLLRHGATEGARALERELFRETWTSADHGEAVAAYFERRPARWGDA